MAMAVNWAPEDFRVNFGGSTIDYDPEKDVSFPDPQTPHK